MTKKQIQKMLGRLPLIKDNADLQEIRIDQEPIWQVTWQDAHSLDSWEDTLNFKECICVSVGFVIRLKTQVVVVRDYCDFIGSSGKMYIPIRNIVDIHECWK